MLIEQTVVATQEVSLHSSGVGTQSSLSMALLSALPIREDKHTYDESCPVELGNSRLMCRD